MWVVNGAVKKHIAIMQSLKAALKFIEAAPPQLILMHAHISPQ